MTSLCLRWITSCGPQLVLGSLLAVLLPQEDSCCTDPHRWMKPLVCPQDFLDKDVCALHFVGWRKSGMPAVYEVS